jgi:putative endonuclease
VGSTPIPGTSLNSMLGLFYFMYFVYILYSKEFDRYYVGHCEDIAVRLIRHNNKGVPSTRFYVPWEVVYTEKFNSRSFAAEREKEIKSKKSRNYVEFLINQKK